MVDTTAARLQQDRIAAAPARFAALVEHSADVITILDRALTITYASPASLARRR
ncbi:MAG: hypothetical protein M3063_02430 [Actinomycetota bacterium]|nr:hypothetical protein [Actinomycetota bacterium]MDQ6945840.1 hypothetical protein [Actinomycetota bacterium]